MTLQTTTTEPTIKLNIVTTRNNHTCSVCAKLIPAGTHEIPVRTAEFDNQKAIQYFCHIDCYNDWEINKWEYFWLGIH